MYKKVWKLIESTTYNRLAIRFELEFLSFTEKSVGTPGGVMVSKLDKQTFMSEFDSHWVSHSYDVVPHQRKKLSKL